MIRIYICPVIGTGTKQDPYRSKAATFGYQYANFIPSNPDGSPRSSWSLAAVVSDDFAAIEADATCDDLFAGDLPAAVNTRPELRTFLRTRSVSDVPTSRRNAILAVLDKYVVDRSDLTGATPLWRVVQRVASTLFRTTANEFDLDFPAF